MLLRSIKLLLLLAAAASGSAQKQIIRNIETTTNMRNLLDAPGFRRAPIKFVPFTPGPEAKAQGYEADKIYQWTDKAGKQQSMRGDEILAQVNQVEKELCARGHSFREKSTFQALNYKIADNLNKAATYKIPPSFVKKSRIDVIQPWSVTSPATNVIKNPFYSYWGEMKNTGEFPGFLADTILAIHKSNMVEFPLALAMTNNTFNSLDKCVMYLFETADASGSPIASVTFSLKQTKYRSAWNGGVQVQTESLPQSTNGLTVFSYLLSFNKAESGFPAPSMKKSLLFPRFVFADSDGKIQRSLARNSIVINNMVPYELRMQTEYKNETKPYRYEVNDPTGIFGFYNTSKNGFKSATASIPFGRYGSENSSSFSLDMATGARYWNFARLLDGNAAPYFETELAAIELSSSQKYTRSDNIAAININRTPANLLQEDATKLLMRICGEPVTEGAKQITYEVFDQRFFIGPVPCRASVQLQGTATTTASGTTKKGTCDMTAHAETTASLKVIGSGGVDAGIAYATITVNVSVVDVTAKADVVIDHPKKPVLTGEIGVKGLAGTVTFNAGFCVPIPYFDDICKNFSIDIYKFNGVEEDLFSIGP